MISSLDPAQPGERGQCLSAYLASISLSTSRNIMGRFCQEIALP
ncbi:MAG: hypothetical protein P0107_01670 [Nitrosomonas sp.]|nr:hypothetical protein [Nitrosomonas sp.]